MQLDRLLVHFPFLLYGSQFAFYSPIIFWLLSVIANAAVAVSVIAMTYAVSFFGFPWTDRVIKSRLFRWVMRGPMTASLTLGVTTLLTRLGIQFNINNSAVVALAMVATIVIFEYLITLFAPIWERFLFYGTDRIELEKIRTLEDRLLTTNDLRQFLEFVLASVCDRLQVPGANLIVNNNSAENFDIHTGSQKQIDSDEKSHIFEILKKADLNQPIIELNGQTFIPLTEKKDGSPISLLGVIVIDHPIPYPESRENCCAKEIIITRGACFEGPRRTGTAFCFSRNANAAGISDPGSSRFIPQSPGPGYERRPRSGTA